MWGWMGRQVLEEVPWRQLAHVHASGLASKKSFVLSSRSFDLDLCSMLTNFTLFCSHIVLLALETRLKKEAPRSSARG